MITPGENPGKTARFPGGTCKTMSGRTSEASERILEELPVQFQEEFPEKLLVKRFKGIPINNCRSKMPEGFPEDF